MSISASFGQSGFGQETAIFSPNKYPSYTLNYSGQAADVNYSASVLVNKGWEVSINTGNPYSLVARLNCEVGSDGITPITTNGTYATVNWSFRYDVTEKDVLHCSPQQIPWLAQVNEQQANILEKALSDPPTLSGSLSASYPQFNTTFNGVTPPVFSGATGNYTAGDVVWNMAGMGWRSIPIYQPVIRYTATVGSGFTLTSFTSNVNRFYSATSLASTYGVPSNFAALLQQDTDPSSSNTRGIPMYYGWLKMPPTIDQQGTVSHIQQEYKYGLYPQNIFGTRL